MVTDVVLSLGVADARVSGRPYPSLAFDSLFENRGSLRNLSILDRVQERVTALQRKVSSTDKAKVDEYLTSVREIEQRIERMRADKDKAEERAEKKGVPALAMERPENGLPEDLRDPTRLMCDIIALAFQTDKTRIASLLLREIFLRSTTRFWACATGTTRRHTTISPTVTSVSRAFT